MNTWKNKRLSWITTSLLSAVQLVFVSQRVSAGMTNSIDAGIRSILLDLRDTEKHRPLETDLFHYTQRAGISSQELTRALVNIMNNSLLSAGEESEGLRAVYALGLLRSEDAFDDLRNVAQHTDRLSTIRMAALRSALRVAGRQLMPFAREIRDGNVFSNYDRWTLFGEMSRRLDENATSSGAQRDKVWERRQAEIVEFLLESAGKETEPGSMKVIDEALCKGVPEYAVSTEREEFLVKTKAQCERIERERGKSQGYVRDYVDRELGVLRHGVRGQAPE